MKFYSIFGTTGSENAPEPRNTIDNDEETVVTSENRSSNERELREICVKWVFPMLEDKRKILQGHHAIVSLMLKANPELVVIDNKGREHTEQKTMVSTEKHRPFDFYNDNGNRNKRTLACIHRLRTQKSLSELKESWGVLEELRKHQAYVRGHAFGEKDREISHIGFIPGVNMTNTNKDVVKEEIATMLRKEQQEVPNFEIIQVRVDKGKGSKPFERTRAYEIQCLQKDASRLAKQLQSGTFRKHPVYVPYRMKRSKPETFKNAIKSQIKAVADQWVIKVQGLTPDMVQCIQTKLREYKAEGIVPTYNKHRGEWKILVNRQNHKETLQQLKENWTGIMAEIPEEVRNSSPMDDPKIISRSHAAYESSSEEGTVDTYGTILSSLYYGTDAEEETRSEISDSEIDPFGNTPARPVNYAQVLRGANSSVSQVSGWTEQRHDELAQLKEKHSTLEEKFNTVTSELGELKAMMKQLLAHNVTSTVQEPPNKKQATFNTPKRSEKRAPRLDTDMDTEHEPATNGSETGQDQQNRNEY